MSQLNEHQQVKYGAVLSYMGIVAYILIGLLYTPWMIEMIGKDDYGLYTLAYSIISLFVFDFGLSVSTQRFLSKYLAEENPEKVGDCVSMVFKIYLYIDVVVFLIMSVVYVLIPIIYTELTPEQIDRLKIVYLIAGIFSVISFPFIPQNGILLAHGKFIQLKICDLVSKVLTAIVNVICLSLGGNLYTIVLTNVIVGVLFIIVKSLIIYRETEFRINLGYFNVREMKSFLSFSFWTMVVALCQRTIFNVAPSILGIFAEASTIAVFGIAISLEAYTFTFANALNGLFLPKISRIISTNGDILPLMIKVARLQILTMGLILVGFIIVGKDFIFYWLGSGYDEAYICTLLFIIPAFFFLPADIADQTLIANGNVKERALVYVVMAVFNVFLSFFMTKYWGSIGLAFAIFIAYMVRNVLSYYMYYAILRINIFSFFKSSFWKMGAGLILSLVFSYFLCSFIHLQCWLDVVLKIVIVIICYVVCMAFFAMDNYERQLLKHLFVRK